MASSNSETVTMFGEGLHSANIAYSNGRYILKIFMKSSN